MTDGPLGIIYNLHEAALHLRLSKQAVSRTARRHGIGAVFGRDLRFTEDDIKAIYEALRIRGREDPSPVAIRATERTFQSLRKLVQAQREERLRQHAARSGGKDEKR